MENEVQPNIPPVQPLPQTSASVAISTPTNWSKILLFTVLGLLIVAGSVFVGIQIGKNQTLSQQPIIGLPTASPTQTIANPTILPTADSTIDWKTFTASFGSTKYSFTYPQNLNPLVTENGSISFFEKLDDQKNCEKIFKGELPQGINSPCLNGVFSVSVTIYSKQEFDKSGINPKSGTNSSPLDPKIFIDNQERTWQTDMVLGEVFNFAGITSSNEKVYIVGVQSGFGQEADNGISFRNLVNQILTSFKFTN